MSEEIKCVFLGDSCVGKTCILNYFVNGSFSKDSTPTIGAAYVSKTIYCDKKQCDLMIWDTAGQEMYRGLAPMYYRNARVAFLVYDITSKKTFEAVSYWSEELSRNCQREDEIVIIVVGNKADLEDQREVSSDVAQEQADSIHATFIEVSALSGVNIERLFQIAAIEAIKKKEKPHRAEEDKVDISQTSTEKKKACC